MPAVLNLDQIKEALKQIDPVEVIIKSIEEGFVAYSQGKVVVPPIGELVFEEPRGDTHIKYGYIRHDDYYVIKIASGFYDNPKLGLPTSSGLMLLFSQKTGELVAVLIDDGYLTQVRTAAAGAVVGKYFAPQKIRRVGVFGAGVQGRMQVEYLRYVRDFKDVIVWGVNQGELDRYKADMTPKGFLIQTTFDPEEIASTCNVIITATPSYTPLLKAAQVRKGTHITAMGSDTAEKHELDPAILKKADKLAVDSIPQSLLRGEVFKALEAGTIKKADLVELGTAISDRKFQRQSDDEITVVDLTGVAVQDIQISKAVWRVVAGRK
ncbi:MAG TPA: ornithine cyclodeaminase family protein [Candidatus Aminicenantes bacterium]|nr:ornithine cyclodeaminase family protein [Candidatus Aminicenantes bacterium]